MKKAVSGTSASQRLYDQGDSILDALLDPDWDPDPRDCEDEKTPEELEREWLMLWKVRENKFTLSLRMLLDIPEAAFTDEIWDGVDRCPEFMCSLGTALIGIEQANDGEYSVWLIDRSTPEGFVNNPNYIIHNRPIQDARDCILDTATKVIKARLSEERPDWPSE